MYFLNTIIKTMIVHIHQNICTCLYIGLWAIFQTYDKAVKSHSPQIFVSSFIWKYIKRDDHLEWKINSFSSENPITDFIAVIIHYFGNNQFCNFNSTQKWNNAIKHAPKLWYFFTLFERSKMSTLKKVGYFVRHNGRPSHIRSNFSEKKLFFGFIVSGKN